MTKLLKNTIPIPKDVDIGLTLSEWSRISGINYNTLLGRVKRGWSLEEAMYRKIRFSKVNRTNFNPKIHEKVGEIREIFTGDEDLIKFNK